MTRPAGAAKSSKTWKFQRLPPERRLDARAPTRANRERKIKNGLGGPRKSLIRPDSDKEIQAFSLGWAWLDFDGFG
jgi:hypothetical protein